MEDRPNKRVERYMSKADEARRLSDHTERHEVRRSLALLAAMWTALARHAQNSVTHRDGNGAVPDSQPR